MQTIIIYRYSREDGGITTSPVKPDVEYTEMFRLVADDGKALTQDGEKFTSCADVASVDGWYEVDAPIERDGVRYSEAIDPAKLNRQYTETDVSIDMIEE